MNKLPPLTDKVAASGTAGLITTVVVGVLTLIHVTPPAAVVSAIVLLVMFAASWLKTETKFGPQVDAAVATAEEVMADMETEGPVR